MVNRIMCAALIVIILLSMVSGCKKSEAAQTDVPTFNSYLDIPNVTKAEKDAIESLKNEYTSFVYGMPLSIEAFTDRNENIRGFSALFCEWLTGLFGIRFVPVLYEWVDLIDALKTGEVDFTGEMRATEERLQTYYMTDPIAERILKRYHLADVSVSEILSTRPIRYALIQGSAHTVLDYLEPGTYEMIYIDHIDLVHDKLRSGEIDAFIHSNSVEANFFDYSDIVADDFFPMINSPVSLAAQNAKFEPIINIVKKALQADGVWSFLTEMYKTGYSEYGRHVLFSRLTADELAYIENHPVVNYAAETNHYPISFYDTYTGQWQGVAFDTLRELEFLTGLSFQIVNDNHASWPELLAMLENGEALMISELIVSQERSGHFLWPENEVMTDYYALLSKSDYPSLRVNEVIHSRVALLRNSAQAEMFKIWFPFHSYVEEYDTIDDAINALDHNEADLLMASENRLLYLTHYRERPDFKANIVFDTAFQSKYGFNINADILRSIIDKAMLQVNTEILARHWMSKTYDYRIKLMESQRPWLLGAIGLSVCVIVLALSLFIIKLREGKRLERIVDERTGELTIKTVQLESQTVRLIAAEREAVSASKTKSRFIANMSHEIRTPMNALVGLADLTLEERGLSRNVEDNLKTISSAGRVLLRLIGDILDVSIIESDKFQLTPKQYDVPGLISDITTLNAIHTEGKTVNFRLDIGDDLPCTLYGDSLRVRQVLNNLLSNAFKYTRWGTVTLGLSCERGDGENVWLSFYVSDTGSGIHPEDVEKLFSDYNQADTRTNRDVYGAGLGLGIVKRLVDQMDGQITVESVYGKGSTFRARVRQLFVSDTPIGPEKAEALRGFRYQNSVNAAHEGLVRPDLSYARVLLVDDFPTNLDVAAGMLRKYKMQVDCLLSGHEAIDRIRAGDPVYDAVFMDYMMPELDGMEAAKSIRALGTEYASTIPIIALTANAVEGNAQLFLENGFQAFLPKPVDIVKLDSVVQIWIRDKSKE